MALPRRRSNMPRQNTGGRRRRRANPQRIVALLKRDGAALEFHVARKLDSPNTWRGHWALGHNLMRWWQKAFLNALAVGSGFHSMAAFAAEGHLPRVNFRQKVTVTRLVPSRRNFIRDDDDLRYTTKPVNDALKNIGLLVDDRREWLEQPMPTQDVSPDGLYWTIVRVEPDDAGALDREIAALVDGGDPLTVLQALTDEHGRESARRTGAGR